MWKQFTIQGNTQYLDMLPKILKQYHNTKHSSIKIVTYRSYNLGQKGLRILKTGVILRTTSSISHIVSHPPPPYNQC